MRRIAIVGMVILAMVALPLVVGAKSGDKPAKFAVCHIPDDGGEPHVITVSEKALAAHVGDEDAGKEGHGDILGDECPTDDELPPANTPPVAAIDILQPSCFFGSTCAFYADGSSSFDDESTITFAWSVDHPDGVTKTEGIDSLIYVSGGSGTYTINLTVTDAGGLTDSLTKTLTLPIPVP